jgi:hypothetical protein
MTRVAILQSNYIPWKGYFDLIDSVDQFIIYDEADYTKNDWRTRNVIKTAHGRLWLSIPVNTKGRGRQAIDEATIVDHHWADKHWKSIAQWYSRAPHFAFLEPVLTPLYHQAASLERLHDVNMLFLRELCRAIRITTTITNSRDYGVQGGRTERLVELCQEAGATHYVSGPSAQAYLNHALFKDVGIDVEYFLYDYDEYPQLHGPFVHDVSIVDTLASLGPDTRTALRGGGLRPIST